MTYSICIDNKVLDYKFEKRKVDTVFRVGDIFIGQLFKIGKSWTAVSTFENRYGPIGGFRTRYAGAEYLINVFIKSRSDNT